MSMRDHALRNGVKDINMPLIGAWHDVLDFCAVVFSSTSGHCRKFKFLCENFLFVSFL